ncbi:MAG: uridine kinase [Crocinitomicaceae bacterium]|nr:uridine kinase [Crocinitomicaceae bacterium]
MSKIKMIVGICGGSGSGKTSLVDKLASYFSQDEITILSMDDYYKKFEEQSKDANGIVNFDLPEAIEHDKIVRDIERLKNGEEIEITEYTFNNPKIQPATKVLKPAKVLIVEGIFLLYFKEILDLVDLSVYIEVDSNIQLTRRLERDLSVRGYSEEQIHYQWEHHVLPCFQNYIEPFVKNADIVINNNEKGEFNVQPIIDKIQFVTA